MVGINAIHQLDSVADGVPDVAQAYRVVWDQLEGPLRWVDPELERFASERGLTLRGSVPGRPSRTLQWSSDIDRYIQVFLADRRSLKFTMWMCAKLDRDGQRFFRMLPIRESVEMEAIFVELPELLQTAYTELNKWSQKDLEFVVAHLTARRDRFRSARGVRGRHESRPSPDRDSPGSPPR